MKRFQADRIAQPSTLAWILFLVFATFLTRAYWHDIPRIAADLFQAVMSRIGMDSKEKVVLSVLFFIIFGIEYVYLAREDHEDAKKKEKERDFLQSLPQRKQ